MIPPPQLKSAMTPFPFSVEADETVERARTMMDEHDVRHLPVTRDHELVGIVSERDLMRLSGRSPEASPRELRIQDVQMPDAYIVDLNEPLDNVLMTMAERHIGSALVTRKGRLAGVFTATDACRAFGEYLREVFPRGDGNDAA